MIKLSFFNLFRRKSRTFLSVLGIAIGVGAIIGLVSVVDGVSGEFNDIVSGLQGIMVMEKGVIDQTLSKLDTRMEQEISSVPGVRNVLRELWILPTTIEGKGIETGDISLSALAIYGVDISTYRKLRSNAWIGEIEKGRMLRASDSRSVVIGKTFAEDRDKFVGSTVKLNGEKFRVKGIAKSESEMLGNMILMDISDAREISGFPADKVNDFYVELINPAKDQEMAEKLNFVLGEEAEAMSTSDFSEMLTEIMGSFNIVVFLVGGLAAFVAGVGIINTILMSVLERTKELGALMATGWTGGNIMKMILYESMFIGIIGGMAGIVLGFGAAEAAQSIGLPSVVLPYVIIEAFVFALFLGLLAGLYPAYRASRLDPVEAIHSG